MEWITNLLKHLGISRSFVGAVFVTSSVVYIGPRVRPSLVEATPKDWQPYCEVALIFSGALLLFWGLEAGWKVLTRARGAARRKRLAGELSALEEAIIRSMGERPEHSLNLEELNYRGTEFSRLEFGEAVTSLEEKGLVEINQFSQNLVSLSRAGRQKALELKRSEAGEN